MGEKIVDARGIECPRPVLLTRYAIKEGGVEIIRVLVDDRIASENVRRMAESQGWRGEIKNRGEGFEVLVSKAGGTVNPGDESRVMTCTTGSEGRLQVVVLMASSSFGTGEEELGSILTRAFLKTLRETEPLPSKVIFVNSGVSLTTKGSEVIGDIRALEEAGSEILSCGTCLDYYGLKEKLEVGRAGNMFEIASSLVQADRLVRP